MEFDTSTAVAAIAATTAAIGLLGAAKMLPNAAIAGWKLVKSAVRG